MTDIPDIVANPILKSPRNQTRTVFSWTIIIKDCLWIVGLAILLGGVLNYTLLFDGIDGKLIAAIQQKQLTDLRQKAEQLYPGSSFINLISSKKLYDDKLALFLDARTAPEYQSAHIYGAMSLPIRTLVQGDIQLDKVLPDKGALLITYCDGGECDTGLELAKELSERGYNNIFVLGEGYPGWEAAGYPIEKAGIKQ
jgi:rhodanese-related sulfurtransferase